MRLDGQWLKGDEGRRINEVSVRATSVCLRPQPPARSRHVYLKAPGRKHRVSVTERGRELAAVQRNVQLGRTGVLGRHESFAECFVWASLITARGGALRQLSGSITIDQGSEEERIKK